MFSSLLLALAVAGCKSASGPGSASFASVIIKNHTPAEIHAAAGDVFREDGYAGTQTGPDRMLFEKEASRLGSLSRDGLVATQAGARTMERVRTELVDLGGGTYRLKLRHRGEVPQVGAVERNLQRLSVAPDQRAEDAVAQRQRFVPDLNRVGEVQSPHFAWSRPRSTTAVEATNSRHPLQRGTGPLWSEHSAAAARWP